jgi:hypothetical protein
LKAIDQSWSSTNQGLPINVEDIIITTGGSEALLLQWKHDGSWR